MSFCIGIEVELVIINANKEIVSFTAKKVIKK